MPRQWHRNGCGKEAWEERSTPAATAGDHLATRLRQVDLRSVRRAESRVRRLLEGLLTAHSTPPDGYRRAGHQPTPQPEALADQAGQTPVNPLLLGPLEEEGEADSAQFPGDWARNHWTFGRLCAMLSGWPNQERSEVVVMRRH